MVNQYGILWIHGLLDSPFWMQDVAKTFEKQGYKSHFVLLPGHGTSSEALKTIAYQEWIDAVDEAISTFKKTVDQVMIAGFSTGAALGIHRALHQQDIAKLLLFAPAIDIAHAKWLWFFRFLHAMGRQWLTHRPENDPHKYTSLALNAVLELEKLLDQNRKALRSTSINIPQAIIHSQADEVAPLASVMAYFKRFSLPQNRLLIYGDSASVETDPRICWRHATYPEYRVVDFSHISLLNAPENPIYGSHGSYRDFWHYSDEKRAAYEKLPRESVFLGAFNSPHRQTKIIERLRFNPDFDFMVNWIHDFLKV